jgi:hypothetical protein
MGELVADAVGEGFDVRNGGSFRKNYGFGAKPRL